MKLEMKGISKSFGSNLVLDNVDFQVEDGEIMALLGENGAGKSTLMNILGGVIARDGGNIYLDGEEVEFQTPKASMDRGIAFIHQELNLINDLAIYENLFIGSEIKSKFHKLNKEEMIARTKEVFDRMDLDLNPELLVSSLDSSYKQIVEISKALLMNARLVIMDEPTTSLTDNEIERVFETMRKLKSEGVGIIFISHKLKEVIEICDKYTILRDGHMISSGLTKAVTDHKLASMMVGHEVVQGNMAECKKDGKIILKAEKLSDGKYFKDISFEISEGEVVGFTGLLGDGRSELFQSIFGAMGSYDGTLYFEGKKIKLKSTSDAVDHKIGYVPRNRKENGIVKDLSILENGSLVTLSKRKKGLALDKNTINKDFEKQKTSLSIKMGENSDLITSLSGGNQQKVILARWLSLNPKLLILDNPTQGVDVGAKEEIYQIILDLARKGVAIIVLSSEAQEIIRLSSRCFVMYHGVIIGELDGDKMSENEIMRLATGVIG